MNKVLATIVGVPESTLEGKNIKLIMPKVIREHHDELIARFFHKGSSHVLGNERVAFLKDFEGFIKPIRFKLEFNYDQRFKYSFLGQIELLKTINVDLEAKVFIPISDSMVFLTDMDYKITDIT